MRGNIHNLSINNENTSQGKLIHPELFSDDKISPKIIKTLIDRIPSKHSFQKTNNYKKDTNKNLNIHLSQEPKKLEQNIVFDDNDNNDKNNKNDLSQRKNSYTSTVISKRKRKASILPIVEQNPLAFINSLKQLNDTSTPYGKNIFKIKVYETFLGFFSFASIVFAIIDNEIYISKSRKFLDKKLKEKGLFIPNLEILKRLKDRKISNLENIIRIFNGCISITCCFILLVKYQYQLICEKLDKRLSEYDGLLSSKLIYPLLFECIISIIFYPPCLNLLIYGISIKNIYAISYNCIFLPFNILKGYNIFRMLIIYSKYNSKISRTICESYKVIGGIKFAIKSEMNEKILKFVIFFFILSCLLLSALVRDFEHFASHKTNYLEGKRGTNDLQNYINNFWLVIIAVTNVAFGDEYPRTIFGRLFIFITSILGILCIGLAIAKLSEKLEFTSNEKEAYLKLKKIFNPENIRNKAANVIKTILMIAKNAKEFENLHCNQSKNFKEKVILLMKIKAETKVFKNELLVSRVYSLPITDLIKNMETKLFDNIMDITKDLNKINYVEEDFELIQKNQEIIQKQLEKTFIYQEKICKLLTEIQNINYLNKDKDIENEKKMKKINKIPILNIISVNNENYNSGKIQKNKLEKIRNFNINKSLLISKRQLEKSGRILSTNKKNRNLDFSILSNHLNINRSNSNKILYRKIKLEVNFKSKRKKRNENLKRKFFSPIRNKKRTNSIQGANRLPIPELKKELPKKKIKGTVLEVNFDKKNLI